MIDDVCKREKMHEPREFVGALAAPTSVALTCRVEEPSTASKANLSARSNPRRYSVTSSALAALPPRGQQRLASLLALGLGLATDRPVNLFPARRDQYRGERG